jgi:hypothetical protein
VSRQTYLVTLKTQSTSFADAAERLQGIETQQLLSASSAGTVGAVLVGLSIDSTVRLFHRILHSRSTIEFYTFAPLEALACV